MGESSNAVEAAVLHAFMARFLEDKKRGDVIWDTFIIVVMEDGFDTHERAREGVPRSLVVSSTRV